MPLEALTSPLSTSAAPPAVDSSFLNLSKGLPALVPRKRRTPPQNPLPVQKTPTLSLPPNIDSISFFEPSRRVFSPRDHGMFLRSPCYSLVLAFVFSLSEACANTKISAISLSTQPPIIQNILSILSSISTQVECNPPKDQGASRFGNSAFRDFFDAVSDCLGQYHEGLGGPTPEATLEVSSYLQHSLGSRSRIDYGSGHELNFILWLLCLNRLSLLSPSSFPALALLVFPRYIHLLRKIQSTYYLEPAGSHGVWGLDDYHFLPFLFGASQLLHHPYIRPLSVHNEIILEEEGDEYMYLDMVRWTMATKSVKGLKWTQPMLDDISGAKSWEKVEQGMRRMFVKEVLEKLPVMQHFLFGSLIPAVDGMGSEEVQDEKNIQESEAESSGHIEALEHIHRDDDAWGDCCGIKIPSTVAAAQEAKKWGSREIFRRVPFD
ncbi:Serine/threonine-protein phosphatase 2A activator 2 [Xylographa soralifera]|nr:Serine/threonine-protein phosphatase 2A activator 2 [Xylographa soralifera]